MATFVAEAMAIGKEPLPSMVILGSRTEFFDWQVNGTDGLLLFALRALLVGPCFFVLFALTLGKCVSLFGDRILLCVGDRNYD